MKFRWIRRANSKTLVAFFGGFACDENILSRTYIPEDCDVAAFFDYRGLETDFDFGAYKNVGVVAWSFGVWVADFLSERIGRTLVRIAINGSPYPVDAERGIPPAVFEKTVDNFGEAARVKFMRRVCGGAAEYAELEGLFARRGADELREELEFLRGAFAREKTPRKPWDIAYASRGDKIFPAENLRRVWGDSLRVCEGEHLSPPLFGLAIAAVSARASATARGFERRIETYSQNAFVQREVAESLADAFAEFAPPSLSPANVLEIGCGTGFLTSALSPKFPSAKWFLNDISEKMCECAAKSVGGEFEIRAGDFMHAEFSEKMDAVLSSSCFQWIPDLRGLFGKISRVSSDGAVLAFSTFGAKNYPQIRSLVGGGLEYRTPYEIRDALAAAGYSVLYCAEDILDAFFPTPKDVLRHIKSTGVNGRFSRFWTPKKFAEFSKAYTDNFSDGNGVVLTYNPIYIIAEK